MLFPLLVATVPFGSMAVGLGRGGLAVRGRFGATGGAIAGEDLIRVLVGSLVVALGWGRDAFAAALVAGFGVAALWPSGLTYRGEAPEREDVRPLAFLGGMAGGALIGQVALTGGPVLLAALGVPQPR